MGEELPVQLQDSNLMSFHALGHSSDWMDYPDFAALLAALSHLVR